MKQPISHVENCDNMQFMAQYPDKFFDWIIDDPPYGINVGNMRMGLGAGKRCSKAKNRIWKPKDWDSSTPDKLYFEELFRVSKNQIIWGGNYFSNLLPPSQYFAIWDKGEGLKGRSFAECEYAWVSSGGTRIFKLNPNQLTRIHPTQKPVSLYDWLLKNYAKEGDKILDTHMGSQSSRIACYKRGFDYWGCELDKEYFDQGNERFQKAIEMPLFEKQENKGIQTSLL